MWEIVLVGVGTVVQLGGVALTIKGAREVWRDVANPDDRFLAPFVHAWRWTRQKTVAVGRRVSGRQAPTQTIQTTGIPSGEAFGTPTVTQGFAPLASGLASDAAIRLLDERLRELETRLHSRTGNIDHQVSTAVQAIQTRLEREKVKADEADERERRQTVEGLRTEAYGFLLLTAGTLIQTAGTFAGMGT